MSAIKGDPLATATGSDHWIAGEWRALGDEGAEALSEMLNEIEDALAWPEQALLNIIVYLQTSSSSSESTCITSLFNRKNFN